MPFIKRPALILQGTKHLPGAASRRRLVSATHPSVASLLLGAFLFSAGASDSSHAADSPPIKLASFARFEVSGIDAVSSLTEADVLQGHATLTRPDNPKSPDSLRNYAVEFPVFHFATNDIVFQFTPTRSGQVLLRLSGFRDPVNSTTLFKEEVLWHQVKLQGALIVDDEVSQRPRPLRSWHDEPADLILKVVADTPVVLRLGVQAVRPEGHDDMRPRRALNTPAHAAARGFSHGLVLMQSLELPATSTRRTEYTEADFERIKSQGFDHVRIPVAWHRHLDKANRLSGEIFKATDRLVALAQKHGMGVILSLHGFGELSSNPASSGIRLYSIWDQVSRHYSKAPGSLAFEILDEPGAEAPTKPLMSLYADLIPMIRSSSAVRTLFVSPSGAGTFSHLARLRLPDDDDNLIVSLDCSDPVMFTQQGTSGTKPKGIVFPGPPETPLQVENPARLSKEDSRLLVRYNQRAGDRNPSSPGAFKDLLALVRQWADHYGRPVYLGQVGSVYQVDPLSRARYAYSFRTVAEGHSMGWAWRGWRDDPYRYWDSLENQPYFGLRDALFSTRRPDWMNSKGGTGGTVRVPAAVPAVEPPSATVAAVASPGTTAPRLETAVSLAQVGEGITQQLTQTVIVGVSVLCTVILFATFWLAKSQKNIALPVPLSGPGETIPACEPIREGLLRSVARMMINTAVPRLVSQKRELLAIQHLAAQELAELERRLEATQAPLQQRLEAYEHRIAELETELMRKGQENQELIKVQISMTRKHLHSVQSRGKAELN